MSVSNSPRIAGPFTGNGVATAFPFTFKVFTASDLYVVFTDALGVNTVLTLNSNYSVALNSNQDTNPGGTITYPITGSPLAAGTLLTATSAVPASQGLVLTNNGGFFAENLNDAYDKLTILVQQLLTTGTNTLQFPISDGITTTATLPSKTARMNGGLGSILGFSGLDGSPYAATGTSSVLISTAMTPVVQAATTRSAAQQLLSGTIASNVAAISDTNVFSQFTGSANSYVQSIWQNTNAGATASTDLVLNNDQGTPTTHYINVGMNSSGFTGTGSLNKAGAGYVTTTTGDLVLGTTTANAIRFVYNNATTDTAFIDNTGFNVSVPTILAGTLAVTGVVTASAGVTTPSINGGQLAGFRNRIINGAFAVDQRNAGAAQTITTAAAQSCVDRWRAGSIGANVTGQRVTGSGAAKFAYQITGAASVTTIGLQQRIESANIYDLAGTTVTLSTVLSNSLGLQTTWQAFYANAVDNFTSTTSIASGTFNTTASPTTFSTNIALPANAQNGIVITLSVGAQTSGTWKVGDVQLEPGTTATPFERRLASVELELCQRYCQKNYAQSVKPGTAFTAGSFFVYGGGSSVTQYGTVHFKETMRTTPTISFWDASGALSVATYWNGSAWTNGGGFAATSSSDNHFLINSTGPCYYFDFGYLVDAEL